MPLTPIQRRSSLFSLLVLGVFLWLVPAGGWQDTPGLAVQIPVVLCSLSLALVAPFRRVLIEGMEFCRIPSPRKRFVIALLVALVAGAYLAFTAFHQGRYLAPAWHDEFGYVIQTQMAARGRLWMAPHPLSDFFDSFQLIQRPVYASMYFPGVAFLYAPSVWLGLPTWILPLLAASTVVGLFYRIIAELIDGVAGLLAALMLLALPVFRRMSTMNTGQVPLLLLALLMVWAWLRWREHRGWGWPIAVGAFAGWAAIIRPIDALAYAIPVGIAIVAGRVSTPCPSPGTPGEGLPSSALKPGYSFAGPVLKTPTWRRRIGPLLFIFIGALPLLILQLVFNLGVTGRFLDTPWNFYARRDHPQLRFGFRAYDPSVRPASILPQKQAYYTTYAAPAVRQHQPEKLLKTWASSKFPTLIRATTPQTILLVFLPISLLAFDRRRAVLAAALPLFVLLYAMYALLPDHYCLAAAPPVLFLILLGSHAILATPSRHSFLPAFLPLCLLLFSLASFPETLGPGRDEQFNPIHLKAVDRALATLPSPSVVLFRFDPRRRLDEEPVFNAGVPWPDDARIVRAHDLGERNREIFQYYADRRLERVFYRFDESTGLQRLGTARDLAAGGDLP